MVSIPAETALIIPPEIVATDVFELTHAPPAGVSMSVTDDPAQIVPGEESIPGTGRAIT